MRETRENEAIALGFGTTVQHKENGVRAHSGGFLQTREAQRGKCNERSLPYHVIRENRMLR